ncbi:MAG: S8 family serine peptidase, partial [Propionibacteriaceae bacterium]
FVGAPVGDDEAYKVTAPSTSAAAISIASMNTRVAWTATAGAVSLPWSLNELSPFSNGGPLRDASITPAQVYGATHEINGVDVTAPGALLQAPLSAQATPDPNMQINAVSQVMAGTSMASPVVTGLVANLLAAERNLTLPLVLDRLKKSATIPAASTFKPAAAPAGTKPYSRDWGYGLVDAASDQFKGAVP